MIIYKTKNIIRELHDNHIMILYFQIKKVTDTIEYSIHDPRSLIFQALRDHEAPIAFDIQSVLWDMECDTQAQFEKVSQQNTPTIF